jgi:CubicO group peptidase (beta-lactamase class C family)
VTIEQLLTHRRAAGRDTGTVVGTHPGGTWDELVAAGVGQRFRAGRRFLHRPGYAALGHLLEVVEHRPWFEVVRDDLLVPLGMTRTTLRPSGRAAQGWAVHPVADLVLRERARHGAMAPAGQLWSTVADLGRWAAFLAEGVLSADTVAEMLEPHMVHEEVGAPWTGAHGLGWEVWNVDGVRYAGHGGSMPGFLAGLRVNLATGDGVVTLLSTTSTPVGRSLMTDLHATLLEAAPKAPTPWVGQGEAVGLDLVGPWHWGPAPVGASLRQGRLVLGSPANGADRVSTRSA